MKKIFIILLSVLVIGIACIFIFSIPKNVSYATVSDVIKNATVLDKNDTEIILTGKVTSQISRKKFWFEDATGQIVIDVDSDLIPLVPQSNQVEIEIYGEVDCEINSGGGVKIEVEKIILDDTNWEEFQ